MRNVIYSCDGPGCPIATVLKVHAPLGDGRDWTIATLAVVCNIALE